MNRGKCPKCGSENLIGEPLKYDDTVSDDSEEVKCLDCGFEFAIAYI